ncbi:MAG: SCO family protein [Opitutaceae bacterium]
MFRALLISFLGILSIATAEPVAIQARVVSVDTSAREYQVELDSAAQSALKLEAVHTFRVGLGDAELDYSGRRVRAEAVFYNKLWHLERIFPIDGDGAKAMRDVNARLHKATATMSRRSYVKQGDYLPDFAMIDHDGRFLQIRELQGKAFVLNFIFTRCTVPTMCPASTTRMSDLQTAAAEAGLDNLHFVTITFDPTFDSPGILRQYADGYGLDLANFHLLTGTNEVVQDLLRQFGILTMEEDGTINHTMATLLVDAAGRVAFRKEGSSWTAAEFMKAAKEL